MGHHLAELHFSQVPVVAASEVWAWLEELGDIHESGMWGIWMAYLRLRRLILWPFGAERVFATRYQVHQAPVPELGNGSTASVTRKHGG